MDEPQAPANNPLDNSGIGMDMPTDESPPNLSSADNLNDSGLPPMDLSVIDLITPLAILNLSSADNLEDSELPVELSDIDLTLSGNSAIGTTEG